MQLLFYCYLESVVLHNFILVFVAINCFLVLLIFNHYFSMQLLNIAMPYNRLLKLFNYLNDLV